MVQGEINTTNTKTRKRLYNARLKLSSFFHHFIFFLEKWLELTQNTFSYYQKLLKNRKLVRIPLSQHLTTLRATYARLVRLVPTNNDAIQICA